MSDPTLRQRAIDAIMLSPRNWMSINHEDMERIADAVLALGFDAAKERAAQFLEFKAEAFASDADKATNDTARAMFRIAVNTLSNSAATIRAMRLEDK